MSPELLSKLALAATVWPRGQPGLEAELKRIAAEHTDRETADRIHGPFIGFLMLSCFALFLLWQWSDGRADRVETELRQVQKQVHGLAKEAQNLHEETERFEFENWRTVVPEVCEASERLLERANALESQFEP